ncbi:MAG TPA: hypothetical protein VMO00_05135 [Methylomirabilota bacterium]|nr:hypothetical protein [Methylomirabilota bacterium]
MTHLKKTLAALGMLLFFIVGGVAVSLAHDAPSAGPLHSPELSRALKYGPAQIDRYTLRVGMDSEAGDVPNSSRPVLEKYRFTCSHLVEPVGILVLAPVYPAKVSLPLLRSVLLL